VKRGKEIKCQELISSKNTRSKRMNTAEEQNKIVSYSAEDLDLIFESTDGRCHLCWRQLSRRSYARTWESDHSVAKDRGGSDYFRNLKPACISCNRSKQAASSRTARLREGHSRAPKSRSARENGRALGTVVGLGVGALFGPIGAIVGGGIGYALGGADEE